MVGRDNMWEGSKENKGEGSGEEVPYRIPRCKSRS